MITATTTVRHELITPTTPTERQVFGRILVGPDGAELVFGLLLPATASGWALRIKTSQQAAVLEELGRMLRIRLREQEQLALQHCDYAASPGDPANGAYPPGR